MVQVLLPGATQRRCQVTAWWAFWCGMGVGSIIMAVAAVLTADRACLAILACRANLAQVDPVELDSLLGKPGPLMTTPMPEQSDGCRMTCPCGLYGKGGVYGGDGRSRCLCDHRYREDRQSAGWVRTTTHPKCPFHDDASEVSLPRRRPPSPT